jgi:hypothetical protein
LSKDGFSGQFQPFANRHRPALTGEGFDGADEIGHSLGYVWSIRNRDWHAPPTFQADWSQRRAHRTPAHIEAFFVGLV